MMTSVERANARVAYRRQRHKTVNKSAPVGEPCRREQTHGDTGSTTAERIATAASAEQAPTVREREHKRPVVDKQAPQRA